MLTSADVGRRVSVRHTVDGGLTDVLGHLLDLTPDRLEVLAHGAVTTIGAPTVAAAKVVPEATPRRGWEVPTVSPDDMQRICWAGWPARDVERLGEWALRAHGGITGRANSAMAVGDPRLPLPDALRRTAEWYDERQLPPLLQLPLADPANAVMADQGWTRLHVTIVQVAPIPPLLAELPSRDDLRAVVEPVPSQDWRGLMHDLDTDDPESHVAILTGPQRVAFATLYRGDQPVGIGRASVEGEWAGVTSVDVAPDVRRQGIGSAVMGALLHWAADEGAVASYLQVRAGNAAALKLYDALGYVTHHPYTYRSPA